MSEFTKTVIVDPDNPDEDFRTIKQGVKSLGSSGGVVIAEAGTYTLDEEDDYPDPDTNTRTTIQVPSNVTIIGRGNAVIRVERSDISAFKNADQTNGNERIRIEGFKIAVDPNSRYGNNTYSSVISVIDMKKVKHSTFSKLYITLDSSSTYGVDELGTAIYLEGKRVTAA